MAEKNKKPEIRFTGFTDAWEQRKYSETFTKIPNNTLSRAELNYNSGLAKNVHYGDVLIKFGELLDIEKDEIPYITDGALVNKFRSSKLQSGDVIIADAAEDETVGKCTELVNVGEETVVSGLHTIPSRPTLSFVSGYLGYFMNSPAYHTQLLRLMQGTKVTSISKAALQDTAIFYPIDSVEQCNISKLFQQLNNLITRHQRKYDKLVIVKKSMLEKMFPKDGANVPEIRVAGFTDAWEQHKISDMYEKVSEKNDLSYGTDRIISVANMYFKADAYISDEEYLRTYNIFKLGDIAFEGNKSNNFAHGRFVENTIGDGIVSHVFDVFRPIMKYDLLFWKYAINNERLMKSVLIRCTKASTMMTNLVASDFLNEEFQFPCLEEQKRIGEFFDRLDNLITLHQRELEKLKNIKESMLAKMFV